MSSEDGVYLEGVDCPNCLGKFLFAEGIDDRGAPLGKVWCIDCGWHALPATEIWVDSHIPGQQQQWRFRQGQWQIKPE